MKRIGKLSFFLLLAMLISLGAASCVSIAADAATNGLVTENGKLHYYQNGKLVKNKLGIKINKKYYRITESGVVKKVSEARGRAGIQLEELGYTKKKSTSTLKKAFNWIWNNFRLTSTSKSSTAKNAIYGFKKMRGNCKVFAACFYYMAKALGFSNVKYVKGYIQNPNGGYTSHRWVTIKINGKTRVYDPNFAYVYHNPKGEQYANSSSAKSGFKMKYGAKGTYKYFYKKNGKYYQYK